MGWSSGPSMATGWARNPIAAAINTRPAMTRQARALADGSAVAAVVRQLNDLLAPMVSQLEAPAPAR